MKGRKKQCQKRVTCLPIPKESFVEVVVVVLFAGSCKCKKCKLSPFGCDAIVDCPFFFIASVSVFLSPFRTAVILLLSPFFPYSESPSERERSDDKGKGRGKKERRKDGQAAKSGFILGSSSKRLNQ